MNKLNYILAVLCASSVMPAAAQETYMSANLATHDLNGTARYVGMGGALDALGADISTISTNPAGVGLFRHSSVSATLGVISQGDVPSFGSGSKTHFSFDQIGFVAANRTGSNSYVNFGVNYHKGRDFNMILAATDALNHASLNKLSFIKAKKGNEIQGGYSLDQISNSGEMMGYANDASNERAFSYTLYDYLNANVFIPSPSNPADRNLWGYNEATGYMFNRKSKGYIGEYDFNISGNQNNRIFWGASLGISDIHYSDVSGYAENLVDKNDVAVGNAVYNDTREIKGVGFNVKAGVILRPVAESPFRIGLSVETPTFYELTLRSYTTVSTDVPGTNYSVGATRNPEKYEFKLNTPWKFGLSLGHTVGDYLAIGAGYEYADYSSIDNRIIDGEDMNYWGDYSSTSTSDREMNEDTERNLKGVSTFKLGLEYKPAPDLAVRFGYNYISPMYNSNGVKSGQVLSYANAYTSSADYVNWKSTNRITCGLGYRFDHVNVDLAYQYSATNGDFFPMKNQESVVAEYEDINGGTVKETEINAVTSKKVSNNRHQVMLTIGYTF